MPSEGPEDLLLNCFSSVAFCRRGFSRSTGERDILNFFLALCPCLQSTRRGADLDDYQFVSVSEFKNLSSHSDAIVENLSDAVALGAAGCGCGYSCAGLDGAHRGHGPTH